MTVLRTIAVLCLVLAGLMLVGESILALADGTPLRLRTFGEWWYSFSPSSLNGAQAAVQRYLWPGVWDPFMIAVLRLPGVIATGVAGGVLFGVSFIRTT